MRATLGTSSKTTRTSLVVSFTHISPSDAGDLGATSLWILIFTSGNDVKVATVVGVAPTVTENASNINSDVDELTVKGTGFDAGIATAQQYQIQQ